MNIITHPRGEVGTVVRLPKLRVQTNIPNEPDCFGTIRAWEVENAAINAIAGIDSARRAIATTRLAYERLRRIISLKQGRAWGFPIYAEEVEALTRAEQLFGASHPEAEQELVRLDALRCEPYADEVASGLFRAVGWLGHRANIVRFGFSADQGWCL